MKKNTIGYIAIIIMLIATSFFAVNLFFQQKRSHDKLNILFFPQRIGNWSGKDIALTEKEYDILETRNLVFREYTNLSGKKLSLFIIYSETNRSVFHPPEVCLIGSGIAIVDKRAEAIKSGKYDFVTSKLYLEKNNAKELVLYCYKAGKFYTDNYYFQQAYLAFHQIFGRRIPGATIRISMPLGSEEKATLAALKGFLSETVQIMDSLSGS